MIRSSHGSRGLAAYRWRKLLAQLGADHPATIAALGRLRFYRGDVPQRDSVTPEAIAWFRESGTAAHWNRHARRRARAQALAARREWLDMVTAPVMWGAA
jgi:hypothetical protein